MAYDLKAFYDELDRLFGSGDAQALERFMQDAEREAQRQEDGAALIGIRNELGGLYRAAGRIDEAHLLYDQVLTALRTFGLEDSAHYATAQINLGDVYLAEHEHEKALMAFLEAQRILTSLGLGEDYRMAALQNNISVAYAANKEFERAAQALTRALAIIGDDEHLAAERATTQVNLAQLKIRTGDFLDAQSLLQEALATYESLGGDIHEGQAWQAMAQVAYFQGGYHAAALAYEKAMQAVAHYFGEGHPALQELAAGKAQAERLAEGRV